MNKLLTSLTMAAFCFGLVSLGQAEDKDGGAGAVSVPAGAAVRAVEQAAALAPEAAWAARRAGQPSWIATTTAPATTTKFATACTINSCPLESPPRGATMGL